LASWKGRERESEESEKEERGGSRDQKRNKCEEEVGQDKDDGKNTAERKGERRKIREAGVLHGEKTGRFAAIEGHNGKVRTLICDHTYRPEHGVTRSLGRALSRERKQGRHLVLLEMSEVKRRRGATRATTSPEGI